MKKLLFLIVLPFLYSCLNSTSAGEGSLGESFEILIGQTVTIPEESLQIHFKDVLEDSRCPEGATCIWAGNARIGFFLNDVEVNLNTYLEPKKSRVSIYTVELLEVNPYPKAGKEMEKEDYTARLLITKN